MRPLYALLIPAVLTTAACSKQAPAPAPEPVNTNAQAAAAVTPTPNAAAEAAAREAEAKAAAERAEAAKVAEALAARRAAAQVITSAVIYFGFDQDNLDDQARATLEQVRASLAANSGFVVQVEGHADDRGSDEYNLALGQRRAANVQRWLTNQGVAAGRLAIISYGEEKLAAQGSDESSHRLNRRAQFVITQGAP